MVRYYSLLMQSAEEEEEDMEGVVPRGYFTKPNHDCQVGERRRNDAQICKKRNNEKNLLLCDNCDEAYHLRCVGLREAPEVREEEGSEA